jgi:hypothetical protein
LCRLCGAINDDQEPQKESGEEIPARIFHLDSELASIFSEAPRDDEAHDFGGACENGRDSAVNPEF